MNIESKLNKIKVKIDILDFQLRNTNLSEDEKKILSDKINDLINKLNLMNYYSKKFNNKQGLLNEL